MIRVSNHIAGLALAAYVALAAGTTSVALADTDDAAPASVAPQVAAAVPAAPAETVAAADSEKLLRIDFTPYVWLPTLNGQFRYNIPNFPSIPGGGGGGSGTIDSQVGPNNYLAKVNFALMGNIVAHAGPAGLYLDLININIGSTGGRGTNFNGPVGGLGLTTASQSQLVTTLFTVAPSFTLYHSPAASVDLMVGGQFIWLSGNASFQLNDNKGNLYSVAGSATPSYSDFIVGLYGHVNLGGKWSLPYLVDGGFGTPSSFQAIGAIRYGNTSLGWRYLQLNAASSTAFLQRLSLGGPELGYTFHF